MLGTYAPPAGYYDAYYGQAQRVRTLIVQEHRAAFERFDLLVSPTSPTVAFLIGERAADPLAMYAADLLTIPSCLAGLPSQRSLRAVRGAAGRSTADRAPVRREHAVRAGMRWSATSFDGAGPAPRGGDVSAVATAWEPVIGLEIHVQLKTRTKMFCRCPNGFGAGLNVNTCPVCLGYPGRCPLPTAAIEWTIKLGLALGCEIAPARSSRGRTTPIPISRRAIRSPSTIYLLALVAV